MTEIEIRERQRERTPREDARSPRLGTRRIVLRASLIVSVIALFMLTGCGRGAEPPPDETEDLFDSAEAEPVEPELARKGSVLSPCPSPRLPLPPSWR